MVGRKERGKKPQPGWARPALSWPLVWRWTIGAGLLLAMMLGAAWGLLQVSDPNVLPLKVVRIDGEIRRVKRADVEQAVGPVLHGNFFTIDVTAVRAAARTLPWVDEVSVRRVWPSTLQLQVREQVPLAYWGKDALVNPRGETFRPKPVSDRLQGLPRLSGPKGTAPEVVGRYLALRNRFASAGLQLVGMRLDARRAWEISLANGLELQLGALDTQGRIERFLRIYPKLASRENRPLLGVDLRYANGLAVRWGESPVATEGQYPTESGQKKRTG